MIYKGPTDGQGISIYKDGLHVGDDDQLAHVSGWTTNNSGRLMIERLFELSADWTVPKYRSNSVYTSSYKRHRTVQYGAAVVRAVAD